MKTYTVPPTSRFNIDVKTAVPELQNESFGARIEVTNGVPIAVERSLYWNANGVFWAGGTNALATPLPASACGSISGWSEFGVGPANHSTT